MNWKDELRNQWYLHNLTGQGAFTTCVEEVIDFIEDLLKKQRENCANNYHIGTKIKNLDSAAYNKILIAPEPGYEKEKVF